MPDRAPLKQLDFYKRNLRPLRSLLRAQAQYETGKYANIYADSWRVIAEAIQYDPRSLEKAAKYFDLDHASALERSVLAAILADIAFATRSAGRRKGATTWDADRLVLLGQKYRELETKNPTLSKEKIVELICKCAEFKEYKGHSRALVVKVKDAIRAFEREQWLRTKYDEWVLRESEIAKKLEAHKKAGYPNDPAN